MAKRLGVKVEIKDKLGINSGQEFDYLRRTGYRPEKIGEDLYYIRRVLNQDDLERLTYQGFSVRYSGIKTTTIPRK